MKKVFYLALCFSLLTLTNVAHSQSEVLSVYEEVLPRFQLTSLRKDLPANDVLIKDDRIYIAGQTALWIWDLQKKGLQRYRLVKNSKSPLRHMKYDGVNLYIASDEALFEVSLHPFKILRYESPITRSGKTIGFSGASDNLWWIHTKALIRIDRYGKTLIPRFSRTGLTGKSLAQFDPSTSKIWTVQGSDVKLTELDKTEDRTRRVFTSKNQIRQMMLQKDGLILRTDFTVVKLDSSGNVVQSVPVGTGRKVVAMAIDGPKHSYLFNDGLLEQFDMLDRSVIRYKAPLTNDSEERIIQVADRKVVIIDNGEPRLFYLSKPVESK